VKTPYIGFSNETLDKMPTVKAGTLSNVRSAAVNIARRALYKKADWEKKGGYKAFHRSFANASTFTTE